MALVAALCTAPTARAAAPSNDDFEHPLTLVTGEAATGSTIEAGSQVGEPVHSTWVAPNRSVWFAWTAPQTGLARIGTCGSAFDTVVAVYGGAALQGLYATRIANNDNGCGSSRQDAALVFLRVQAGTTYRIALDGWTWHDAGDYRIVADLLGEPGAPPPNDEVAAAVELRGEGTAAGTNVGATSGWNEWPAHATQLVWWHWVSPVDGQVRVDTCASGFDTVLGVMRRDGGDWAGGDIASDGCGDRGMVELNAFNGREYWIGVGGEEGASGPIAVRIDATPDRTAPATTITSGPTSPWGRRVASIAWAVQDEAPATSECSLDGGPWFECWGEEPISGLAEGEHSFRVRSTDQYGNAEDPGAERRFTVVIPPAPNDDFADAAVLVPGAPVSVNNGKATAEPGEPSHDSWYYAQGLGANWSVWFEFTPPADDVAELSWCAGGFEDVTMAVYTGTAVNALTRVGQRDEGCRDSLYVDGGTTYRVAFDGVARNLDYGTGPMTVELAYLGTDPDPSPSPAPSPIAPPSGADTPPASGAQLPDAAAGPGTTGGPAPLPRAELRLDASRVARARVDRRGRFVLRAARVRCAPGPACVVPVKVLARRRASTLGSATLRVRPGVERFVTATLSRSARALLARRGRLPARVRLRLASDRTRTARVVLLRARAG